MKFDVAKYTDAGPRSVNEDEVAVWEVAPGELAVIIADGLGGMGGGRRASQIAYETFKNAAVSNFQNEESLKELANIAHLNILAEQQLAPEFNRMATTLSAGIFIDNFLTGVHCGDTRISVIRGDGIKRLTVDHSEGQRFFDSGKISKEDLFFYPRKNILESALGVRENLRIDTFNFPVMPRDRYIFTSDGVHGLILLREMRKLVAQSETASELIEKIKDLILKRGADDNFSVAAVFAE